MMPYLERNSPIRWSVLLPLFAAPFFFLWLTIATKQSSWLALAILPVLVGLAFWGLAEGVALYFLTVLFMLYAGLRQPAIEFRLAVWFQIFVLTLSWGMAVIFKYRERQEERAHREYFSSLEERLILAREQYKTDLVVNISNQKKNHKYFLLNRVSRLFGSQLELNKLADVVIRELREIIGADRGCYMLAYLQPGGTRPLIWTSPDGVEADTILDDQFGLWAAQHRTALLVADAQKDFRFRGDLSEGASRSLMVAPLLVDGRVTGMLRAESAYPEIFTTDDLRLFTILSDLAGVAAENTRLYQRTQELAITDGLTGLYLRRFFNHRLDEEIARFQEAGTTHSLLIVDLDHFKRINDRLGHLAGDQVLAQLAETLRAETRTTDLLCRFGGEEFALLLPYTPCQAGMIMAERIRSHVARKNFMVLQQNVNITVSIGVAGCPEHARDAAGLIKAADEALYVAKREGRNRAVLTGGAA